MAKTETTPDERQFTYENKTETYAFLQWKGTDACFDFNCDCGEQCHFDGFFAYYVKCPHCEQLYQMPFNLFPKKVEASEDTKPFVVLEKYEDYA